MKRLWIGVGIMVVVITACVWGQITVNTACNEIIAEFSETLECAKKDDFEGALANAMEVQDSWSKYSSRLFALKNHEDLHDLMLDVNIVTHDVESENVDEIDKTCSDAITRLKHIKDGEKISFGNIF